MLGLVRANIYKPLQRLCVLWLQAAKQPATNGVSITDLKELSITDLTANYLKCEWRFFLQKLGSAKFLWIFERTGVLVRPQDKKQNLSKMSSPKVLD